MRIANLLRASLESNTEEVTIGSDELAVDSKLTEITKEFAEQPTAAEVLEDVETATTAVNVLDEIVEMRDSGDAVAMESAAYGLSVFQRTHGIHTAVSVESLHDSNIPFIRGSILTAATESLEKDIKLMHKKFDNNRKSIIDTRNLLNRVRGELRKRSYMLEDSSVEINLTGVLSYFSRDMVPVTDIVKEIKLELENIKIMRQASKDVKDKIVKLSKEINALPNNQEGIAGFNNALNQFSIVDEANKLSKLSLLNSGKIELNETDVTKAALVLDYHTLKDGSSLGFKNWLKVGAKALISTLAGSVVIAATNSRGLGNLTTIGGLVLTGLQTLKAKRDAQGSKTNVYHTYSDLEEYLNVVDEIMNIVIQDSISQNEMVNAIRVMYSKAKQLSVHSQGGSMDNIGAKVLAFAGNALAKHHLGVDPDIGGDKLLELMNDNIFGVEMTSLSVEEAVDTHCIVTGASAVAMCNNILAAIKK